MQAYLCTAMFSLTAIATARLDVESPEIQFQLKTLVSTNSGLRIVPVGASSHIKAVVSGVTNTITDSASQTYYSSPLVATTAPSTEKPLTSSMTPLSFQTNAPSTTSSYASPTVNRPTVPCAPDLSSMQMNGQCVLVEQLEQQCGALFEAAQSTKDCGAFDGNWCCYVLIQPSYGSSTSKSSSLAPTTVQTIPPARASSYATPTMASSASTAVPTRIPPTAAPPILIGTASVAYGARPGAPANKISISDAESPMGPFTFAEIMKLGRGQRLKSSQPSVPSFAALLHQAIKSPEFVAKAKPAK